MESRGFFVSYTNTKNYKRRISLYATFDEKIEVMTNVVGEIVGIVEEVRSDERFRNFESVMLYDIETADFGFLHHVGDTGRVQWRGEIGAREYLENRIIDLIIGEQVSEQEIRKHGTDLIKLLGGNEELLEQERKRRSGAGKNAILNAIENLYDMYGESLNEPFFVKFLKDTLEVNALPLRRSDRESFLAIRERLTEKRPWQQLRIYSEMGKKYFYYALRDFTDLGEVRQFFLKNDGHNNNVFAEAGFRVYNPGDPDEYIELVLKHFKADEVLPGDLNQVIYFLDSPNGVGFEAVREEFKKLFSLLAKSPRGAVNDIYENKTGYAKPTTVNEKVEAKKQKLSRESLSISNLRAYCSDETVLEDYKRIVKHLSTCDWTFIPDYFTNKEFSVKHRVGQHPYRNQNWGRTGIEFGDWVHYPEPGIFMGFLLDHSDHRMDPIDPENIDELMFTIDVGTNYKDALIQSDLNDYAEKFREKIPGTRIFGPRDITKSPWRKLVIRETLSNVIQGKETTQEQVDAIYHRLKDWCNVVFDDGKVEKIFRDLFEQKKST